jgi:hypothetical protein
MASADFCTLSFPRHPASFGFRLATDTLAFGWRSLLPGAQRTFTARLLPMQGTPQKVLRKTSCRFPEDNF